MKRLIDMGLYRYHRKVRQQLLIVTTHYQHQMAGTRNALMARSNDNIKKNRYDLADLWLERFKLSFEKNTLKNLKAEGFSPEQSVLLVIKSLCQQQQQTLLHSECPIDGQWSTVMALRLSLTHYQHYLLLQNITINNDKIEDYYTREISAHLRQQKAHYKQSA